MVFHRTLIVLYGALVASVYGAAVLGAGAWAVRACLGRHAEREWVGESPGTAAALAFVMGQGVVGLFWLALALAGILVPQAVWIFIVAGCLGLFLWGRPRVLPRERVTAADRPLDRFYMWIRRGILVLLILRGFAALLPTKNDDALLMYLVTPRMVAATRVLQFQPYVMQHGLMPLQVEMHWAALFAVSNETAVTFWDYLCSLGTLATVAALGVRLGLDSRGLSMLVLMLLTTPGFTLVMGAGKPDNAAAQFGLAAFLWLRAGPRNVGRLALLSGLCIGWAMASRYTSFVLLPAWLFVLIQAKPRFGLLVPSALGAAAAWTPMLLKNWLLVGHPLAPFVGDPGSFWFWRVGESARNLAWVDVLFYPFVWTFGDRPMMLGNLSPLFLGFMAPWLICRHAPEVRRGRQALGLGLLILATWIAVEARALHTRYLLVGLGLTAVGLAPAFVALDERLGRQRAPRFAGRAGLVVLAAFWLTVSTWTAYEAVRYTAGFGHREDRYRRKDGFDVAEWLNAHVGKAERVSLLGYSPYRYLLRPDILDGSESRKELEWAWEAARTEPGPQVASQVAMAGRFRHVVGRREAAAALLAALPASSQVAFTGAQYVVVTLPH